LSLITLYYNLSGFIRVPQNAATLREPERDVKEFAWRAMLHRGTSPPQALAPTLHAAPHAAWG